MSESHHALRGALNALVLQLEIARVAFERDQRELLGKALEAAREAAQRATDELAREARS